MSARINADLRRILQRKMGKSPQFRRVIKVVYIKVIIIIFLFALLGGWPFILTTLFPSG
jgi:hypothetical protein